MSDDDFFDRFSTTLIAARASHVAEDASAWSPELREAIVGATARIPSLLPEALARYVAERLPPGPLAESLSALHLSDLSLACACAPSSSPELRTAGARAFERVFHDHLGAIIGRLGDGEAFVEEMRQRVYDHLLVGRRPRGPRLLDYTGRGPLLAYVRVVATREALQDRRRTARRREDDDGALMQVAVEGDDPELLHLKAHYQEPLREAFTQSLAALEPRARTLLRYQVIDRLSIDKIAAIYGIHRSTAARQIARAREALIDGTHERLRRTLGVDTTQLDSILALIRSQVDISVYRLLNEESD